MKKTGPKPRPYSFQGESKTLAEWCEEIGIPIGSMRSRIVRNGWPAAIELPYKAHPTYRAFGKEAPMREWMMALGLPPHNHFLRRAYKRALRSEVSEERAFERAIREVRKKLRN